MSIRNIERFQMDTLRRVIESQNFKSDLNEIESFIQSNYDKLHYHWGIKINLN